MAFKRIPEFHPAVRQALSWFEYEHLLEGDIRDTARRCSILAYDMASMFPDNPEITYGLRELLAAKDCFVRAAIHEYRKGENEPKG